MDGRVKLHTDDIINKSTFFRITKASSHIIHTLKNEKVFNKGKIAKIMLGQKR